MQHSLSISNGQQVVLSATILKEVLAYTSSFLSLITEYSETLASVVSRQKMDNYRHLNTVEKLQAELMNLEEENLFLRDIIDQKLPASSLKEALIHLVGGRSDIRLIEADSPEFSGLSGLPAVESNSRQNLSRPGGCAKGESRPHNSLREKGSYHSVIEQKTLNQPQALPLHHTLQSGGGTPQLLPPTSNWIITVEGESLPIDSRLSISEQNGPDILWAKMSKQDQENGSRESHFPVRKHHSKPNSAMMSPRGLEKYRKSDETYPDAPSERLGDHQADPTTQPNSLLLLQEYSRPWIHSPRQRVPAAYSAREAQDPEGCTLI